MSMLDSILNDAKLGFNQSIDVVLNIDKSLIAKFSSTSIPWKLRYSIASRRSCVFVSSDFSTDVCEKSIRFISPDETQSFISKREYRACSMCFACKSEVPRISKFAKVLGPVGLMPNPKVGTVLANAKGCSDLDLDNIEDLCVARIDKCRSIHAKVGDSTFDVERLNDNIASFVSATVSMCKARLCDSMCCLYISSTMGKSLRLNVMDFL